LAANTSLARSVAALEKSTAIHSRLTEVAAGPGDQQTIADAVADLTGLAVAIEDPYGNLRAWAGPGRPDPYPKDPPERRAVLLREAARSDGPMRYRTNLLALAGPQDDPLGVLVLYDPDQRAGEAERVAVEHGATVLGMELARLRSLAETELRLGRDLVEELLAGIDEERAFGRAQALGYDLQRPHRVLVVEAENDGGDHAALFHAARRAARDAGIASLLGIRGSSVIVLTHTDADWSEFRARVRAELGHERCRLGIGGRATGPSGLPRSLHEAQLALRIQRATGSDDAPVEFGELGVYRLLADVREPTDVEQFARQWLGPLIDYDAGKGSSDLVTTLSRYLENGGNYEATARSLLLHRSTLKYRVQRIRAILQLDLNDPDTKFNLQLATRAWDTLHSLRGDPG
jgi:DNA-binding PucR family transcriptional regulator